MTQQEHVLAEEEQMAAALTKQHEEEKHTGKRTEKKNRRKQGKQARESYSRRRYSSSKASRLCCKAQPGTLPHDLPSPSYSRRQRYQGPVLTMVVPSNEHIVFSEPIRTVGRETKTTNRLLQDFNVNDTTGVCPATAA